MKEQKKKMPMCEDQVVYKGMIVGRKNSSGIRLKCVLLNYKELPFRAFVEDYYVLHKENENDVFIGYETDRELEKLMREVTC